MRHLIGRAVGDAATLARPLATPGPRLELEKVWRRRARKHNKAHAAQKKLKKKARQKQLQLTEQRPVNGAPVVNGVGGGDCDVNGSVEEGTAAEVVHGGCNGELKGGMLNAHASAKKKAS